MNKLHKSDINHLLKLNPKIAITIYAPMHISASPPHITENRLRLKNLFTKAIDELRGIQNYDLAEQIENKMNQLENNSDFWHEQTAGLLICMSDNFIEMFSLPIDTEEYVSVDNYFQLAPLIGIVSDEQIYYCLEVNEHQPKLLIGDMYELKETDIELPKSLNEVTHNETSSGLRTTDRSNLIESSGYPGRFFKILDRIIMSKVDTKYPLILIGSETDLGHYESVSHYPNILESKIHGKFFHENARELHDLSQAIIKREVTHIAHDKARQEYEHLKDVTPERVAVEQEDILRAAEQGRIEKLLTTMSIETADNIQDSMSPRERITFSDPRLNGVLNGVTRTVFEMSGKVLNMLPSEMPANQVVLAKLRY